MIRAAVNSPSNRRRHYARCSAIVRSRRGSVIVTVVWALAIATLITAAMQLFGFRQAALGREAIGRVQARWAARAGIEQTFAVMALNNTKPLPDDAVAIIREMEQVARGDLDNTGYDIRHHTDGRDWAGPMDEHAKLNLATPAATLRALLMGFDDMTFDMIDALSDWVDKDDEVRDQGAERDYYLNMPFPYQPRNGTLRSVAELELVAGFEPRYVRGEDWSLDERLDWNEDDGSLTLPPDDRNGALLPGYAAMLTTYSRANGATASGQPRIRLGLAQVKDLQDRLQVDAKQAEMLIRFGRNTSSAMSMLLAYPLSRVQSDGSVNTSDTAIGAGGAGGGNARASANPNQPREGLSGRAGSAGRAAPAASAATDLTDHQLRAVFTETMLESRYAHGPGRINLNTVSIDLLRRILKELGAEESLADEIRYLRDTSAGGILSMVDLKRIPILSREENRNLLKTLADLFDTQTNVFTIASRGRSWGTGMESEIIVVVDRSTLPVRILEYREP